MASRKRRTLRVGFVGTGGISALQMKQFSARGDVELVAMADIDDGQLQQRMADYPDARGYSDYRRMLRAEALDAVSVCTPNRLHAAPTIHALKAGCHVLCEKPLAMSVTEGRRMLATAQAAGRTLVIGFQYRYDPRTQYIREAYDDGCFGDILYGRVQAMRRRGIPNWGVFGQKALSGGGPLIDIGVHVLEMTHYAMGGPTPVSASADMFTYLGNRKSDVKSMWAGWDHKTYDVEDLAVGRIRFDNGAVLTIESSYAAHIGDQNLMNFQLMGTRGGATWEPTVIHTDEHGHMVDKKPAWLADTSFNAVFNRKIDGFVDHVLHRRPTIASGTDGLVVQAMLNALYESAAKHGREVRVPAIS